MRKITIAICSAFQNRQSLTMGNSHTDSHGLYLFGNCIAKHSENGLMVCSGGWQSATTKERLNGLAGVSVNQAKGVWYLNGNEWDGQWTIIK